MAVDHELWVRPIGRVVAGRSPTAEGDCWGDAEALLEVDPAWAEALDGIEDFSHIWVVWWIDQTSAQPCSEPLHVHPEQRQDLPLVGILATRSPRRPNPIAITAVRLLGRQGARLRVQGLDAYQDTPILDIKPYLRRGDLIPEARVPDWLERLWQAHDEEQGQ